MELDFGLLSGLSGKKNWDAIRQQKRDEIAYQSAINQMQEKEIAEQQQQQQAMAQYLATASSIPVLEQGMARIKEVDAGLRPAIAEKIKKYGGDLDAYMKVEGMTDMQNYLKSLLNHPTTQRELLNARQVGLYEADKKEGKWERMTVDPETGMPVNTFEEQLRAYQNGEAEQLDYKGAFTPGKFDEKIFGTLYGSPNKYQAKQVGTKDYVNTAYRALVESGMNPQDAMQQALMQTSNYQKHLQAGGTPLYFKWDTWKPTAAWNDSYATDLSAKYLVDAVNAVTDPNREDIWNGETTEINLDSPDGKSLNRIMAKTADVLPQFDLGDATVEVEEQTDEFNASGQRTGTKVTRTQKTVKDYLLPFMKDGKGNVYMQTYARQLQGQPALPMSSGNIDVLFANMPKNAQTLKVMASVKKAMDEKGLMTGGRPDFSKDDKAQEEGTYTIKGKKYTLKQLTDLGYTEAQVAKFKE